MKLFITSNSVLFTCITQSLGLKQTTKIFYEGKCKKKQIGLLLLENNKIESTLILTHFLSKVDKPTNIVILNPIQCPDTNLSLGQIVIADSITEWDKPVLETSIIELNTLDVDYKVIKGKGMSGDRICMNKTTPILQSKLIDIITYPVSKVAEYFSIPLLSIGIVTDYCTPNYSKLLQSNIKELSSRITDFVQLNLLGD